MLEGIDEINSFKKLDDYLRTKPVEWAQKIALLCALRVFPVALQPLGWTSKNPEKYSEFILSVWRAISITTLAVARPDAGLKTFSSARTAASARVRLASSHRTTKHVSAVAGAAAYAAYATYAAYAANADGASNASSRAAKYAIDASANKELDMWGVIRSDLKFMELGNAEDKFMVFKPNGINYVDKFDESGNGSQADWRIDGLYKFEESEFAKNSHWLVISQWFKVLIDSDLQKTPWGDLGSEWDFEIALKPDEFWARDPNDVMKDIAKIVGWPDYGQGNDEFVELKERQISFGKAIIREFPSNPNKDALNSYLSTLNAHFNEIDFKRLNEFWLQCQGNKLDIYSTSPDQMELWVGFDQTHYSIMQISPYKDEFNSFFEMEDNRLELAPLLEAENNKYGARFVQVGDQYRIDQIANEEDISATSVSKVQQLHPRFLQQLEEFQNIANALNNQLGWQGVAELNKRLLNDLTQGLDHVAANISTIWLDIVELGSYWDQDQLARETDNKEIDPLDPDRKRKLEHLITTASIFIRSFPTAHELDEEVINFKQAKASLTAGRDVILHAKSIELMSASDADLMIGAFDAEERGRTQGEKAGIFAFFTSRNFVQGVATSLVAGGIVASGTLIKDKSMQFFRGASPAIMRLWADVPSSYSTALKILIEQAKDEHNLPRSPQIIPRVDTKHRDEDEENSN